MKITLKMALSKNMQPDVNYRHCKRSAKDLQVACQGEVDGEEEDLRTVIDHDCEVKSDFAKDDGFTRHTASHDHGTGNQTTLPGDKTCDWTVHRRRFYV